MAEFTFIPRKTEDSFKQAAEMSVPKQKKQWQVKQHQHERNWLELPSDVTVNILHRIGVVEILESAQKVCTAWREICKDPSMWRVIHMKNIFGLYAHKMSKDVVDRSQGQLVDISIVDFPNDELLQYVANRASQLKRLEFVSSYRGEQWNWTKALKKFPMLEELNLYKIQISKEAIETAGRCCPMLKSLKVNQETCKLWHGGSSERSLMIRNRTAKAIGENLHELRELELIGNNMTNIGLQAILDGCPHLQSLDLRQCLYIDLKGDMGKKCSEQINCLKLPEDSLEECIYVSGNNYADCEICGDDYDYTCGVEDWRDDDVDDWV